MCPVEVRQDSVVLPLVCDGHSRTVEVKIPDGKIGQGVRDADFYVTGFPDGGIATYYADKWEAPGLPISFQNKLVPDGNGGLGLKVNLKKGEKYKIGNTTFRGT